MTRSSDADWLSIILQGLLGGFLGALVGGGLVMNRITRILASDPAAALIVVVGCMVAGAGLFMRSGDRLLIATRTIPSMPLRHSTLSLLLSRSALVVGSGIVVFGFGRHMLSQ